MANTNISKPCSKCKIEKPLSEFYKDRSRKDGHASSCKVCKLILQQTEHARKLAHASEKRWRMSNLGQKRQYRKTEKYKAYDVKRVRRYNETYPDKYIAHYKTHNAVAAGKLPHPKTLTCSCNQPAKEYHHHLGYERKHWLDIIPKCILCHRQLHLVTTANTKSFQG